MSREKNVQQLEDVIEFKPLIDTREASCRNCGGNCNHCNSPNCQQTCHPCHSMENKFESQEKEIQPIQVREKVASKKAA